MNSSPPEPEVILDIASHISKFHMNPNFFVDFILKEFDPVEIRIDGIDIKEWSCKAYAFGKKIPCLPSGLTSGKPNLISKINYPTKNGTIVFRGNVLPKVDEIVETPSITLPEEWEETFVKAMLEGDYEVSVSVETTNFSRGFIKEGDDVCVATYYQSFWYGTSHNATTLALLSKSKTKRTLIFLPYLGSEIEPLLENCSVVYLIEGFGACDSMSRDEGILRIGCKGKWFGSPFDTPDKVNISLLHRQLDLIWALLT